MVIYKFTSWYPHGVMWTLCFVMLPALSKPAKVFTAAATVGEIRRLPEPDRIKRAVAIYKERFRKADEATTERAMDELLKIAAEITDKKLECAVYELWADYYSVNRGFNQRSDELYEQAIRLAQTYRLPYETGLYLYKKGMYYATYKKNTEACLYFLRSREQLSAIGFARVPDCGLLLGNVASFYYTLGDYENARTLLLEALRYQVTAPRDLVNFTNTLGLIYRNCGHYDKAMVQFNKAVQLAGKSNDSVWVTIAKGNIGSVYFYQKDYARALPYLELDYKASAAYGDKVNAAAAMLRMARISFEEGRSGEAAARLGIAEELIRNYPGQLQLWIRLHEMRSEIYQQQKDFGRALIELKKTQAAKDTLAAHNNIEAVERVRLKWKTTNYLSTLNKLETRAEIEKVRRNGMLIVMALLLVIFFLIYNRARLKSAKDHQLLELEKRRLDAELASTSSLLQQYIENLLQKNLMIENIRNERAHLQVLPDSPEKTEELVNLEKLMQATIITDEKWTEFKRLFMKVHQGFFTELRKKYTNLTETDLRIITLIRLRLGNREMANMLGITIDGVKKSKQRLRKKMGLSEEPSLEKTIESI
ncbi:tetratricopeptide repeat protein [Hufsiella ginkgonis]|uniref:Tetratricopeptide repeat protein n=1 Tax=Hufsiella ginkgonis TaxID=2695274 RepID=A0A7K1XXM8_9SPHI|nr:tetratricopeptide repeat protein [Hufsiella ginkgonis]MXV15702.1 hypothetical protein [Hufsiella ginkgonis]